MNIIATKSTLKWGDVSALEGEYDLPAIVSQVTSKEVLKAKKEYCQHFRDIRANMKALKRLNFGPLRGSSFRARARGY